MAGLIREVPAVGRAIDVLDLFLDGKGPRSVAEITAALGLPRSTTYELVQTLVARRCLRVVDGHAHQYDLGLHLFELGSAYGDSIELTEQGQQVAQEIVARSNETVHVATLDGAEVVYLVKAESPKTVRMVSAVGRRLPAHCTAVGKAMLAGLDDEDVVARYDDVQEWIRMTPNSVASLPDLLAELDRTRQRGLAVDDCESNVDVRCVAAAVRDASGEVVAGMSISAPAHRADERADELAGYVSEGALELSTRLGYRRSTR
ncbi:IclR family transcriptional regulator [Phytoactinopolyspora mesophila]|uniref:Helix-turn-helix domain-containing protein n=1 Tax=Phytoactinopolyspora mesophila TaxID=2650750 RepID=A0A7K3M1K0_9ACTN|nr:IclR family transcriptional regulator [Phytoactinopolyspora mesophila]NDL57120.1 helix-turn-helix domain-containing protein [Phytoactinopolyspora mesophila]